MEEQGAKVAAIVIIGVSPELLKNEQNAFALLGKTLSEAGLSSQISDRIFELSDGPPKNCPILSGTPDIFAHIKNPACDQCQCLCDLTFSG